jgi:uncharacterized protein (DUF885 family)
VFTRPLLAVASYSGPPAFSESLTGHFFVPIAPDGTSEEDIQKRLASNSYSGIPTTAVHEAYPGHHWHISWSKIHAPRLRRVLQTPYFSEGWALYAERVMRERGFFEDPIHVLNHLEATIFRAARIVVDTSLHIGEMTYDEAVTYMTQKTALSEPTARAEVGRYCTWPTQASSYLRDVSRSCASGALPRARGCPGGRRCANRRHPYFRQGSAVAAGCRSAC